MALAKLGEIFLLGLPGRGAVLEDQMRDEHRAGDRDRRAGVEFVVQPLAQRVFFQLGEEQARMHGVVRNVALRQIVAQCFAEIVRNCCVFGAPEKKTAAGTNPGGCRRSTAGRRLI